MALLSLVTNVLLFGSLAVAIGVVSARWWIVPDGRSEWLGAAARIGVLAASALLLALALVLLRQLLEFRDPFVPWRDDLSILLATSWGATWKGALGVGLLAAVAFGRAREGGVVAWLLASAAVVVLSAFPALTGHASGGGRVQYTVPADIAHVLAMGTWMGGLTLVLLLDRGSRRSAADSDGALPELVPRFSPFAMASVAVLVLSGAVGMWAHLDAPTELLTTAYGRWLALKLGVVAAVLLLGAFNVRRLLPRLATGAGAAAMRRSAWLEVSFAGLVLVVTAILVRVSPG